MARAKIDIDIRIERQEKKIINLKNRLEEAQKEYDELMEEKKEVDHKKLIVAFSKSKRSLDEVMNFLNGKADI